MGSGGGGRTHLLLLDLVIRLLITHPYLGGAPFLLLIETPPRSGGGRGKEGNVGCGFGVGGD